jgi:hypothetical protein
MSQTKKQIPLGPEFVRFDSRYPPTMIHKKLSCQSSAAQVLLLSRNSQGFTPKFVLASILKGTLEPSEHIRDKNKCLAAGGRSEVTFSFGSSDILKIDGSPECR